jgi:hypothetical protein
MSYEHLWVWRGLPRPRFSPFSHVTAAFISFIVGWPKGVSPKPTFFSQHSRQNRKQFAPRGEKVCLSYLIHPFGLDKL